MFHDIDFEFHLENDLPEVVGDPSQIQQVLTNIIINAANAMQGKGKLTITSGFSNEMKEVVLTFKDTGPGIPDTIIDKIFEPFFTHQGPGGRNRTGAIGVLWDCAAAWRKFGSTASCGRGNFYPDIAPWKPRIMKNYSNYWNR